MCRRCMLVYLLQRPVLLTLILLRYRDHRSKRASWLLEVKQTWFCVLCNVHDHGVSQLYMVCRLRPLHVDSKKHMKVLFGAAWSWLFCVKRRPVQFSITVICLLVFGIAVDLDFVSRQVSLQLLVWYTLCMCNCRCVEAVATQKRHRGGATRASHRRPATKATSVVVRSPWLCHQAFEKDTESHSHATRTALYAAETELYSDAGLALNALRLCAFVGFT